MGALEVTAKCRRHIWKGRRSYLEAGNTLEEVSTIEFKNHILGEGPQLCLGITFMEAATRTGELEIRMTGSSCPRNKAGGGGRRPKMG